MGRRLFGFSKTQINKMISANNAYTKYCERQKKINSQVGIQTEKSPEYFVSAYDFSEDSRIAHIEFIESNYYRKIDKYVTQNGVRHPIYSGWNVRTKKIKKTIKVTNEILENLDSNPDELIQMFRHYIVATIVKKEDLYPSWFIKDAINVDSQSRIDAVEEVYNEKINSNQRKVISLKNDIEKLKNNINHYNAELLAYEKKRIEILAELKNAKKCNNIILFTILTFGIYGILHSKKRVKKLETRYNRVENVIEFKKKKIEEFNTSVVEYNKDISIYEEQTNKCIEQKEQCIEIIRKHNLKRINDVEPLPTHIIDAAENTFIPLKELAGMSYEKIVGCYVIHNIEKNKYYVGQSKDVMRRILRQHFDGTTVKNFRFAEDYYTSKFEKKEDLFEVRIIKLSTKDELDRVEKELIESYDAFKSGYNGTNGNL